MGEKNTINDLRDFINLCEQENDLRKVQTEVDWNLELCHVAKKNEEKDGPALLFENVKGYKTPVITSIFSSTRHVAMALNAPKNATVFELAQKWIELTKKGGIPPVEVDDGPIMENQDVGEEVDLTKFPVPKYFPDDGGRFFGTAVCLLTQDPDNGIINLGTYRMEMLDRKSLGALILKGKDADITRQKYAERKELMPAAAIIGGDPRLFFLSASSLPYEVSEYDLAGSLREKPVEVIKSDLTGLPIPAFAEIVAEGFIDPNPDAYREEGPFGEYTGYYSKGRLPQPWLDVKRVLYRNNPVFWGTNVGRPPTANVLIHSISKTAALWTQLNDMKIPGIKSVYFPPAAGRFWAVISVKQMYPGHGRQVGLAAISTVVGNYGVKGIIVVDDDIRADDWDRVMWAMSVRYNPIEDTEIIKKGRSTALDPSLPMSNRHITSRIIIDATIPYEWEDKPKLVSMDSELMKKIEARWSEYGID